MSQRHGFCEKQLVEVDPFVKKLARAVVLND
jgi:hypothetical protein